MLLKILFSTLVWKVLNANEVICNFDTLTFWGLTCGISNQTIENDGKITFNIDEIAQGKSFGDVNCVEFADVLIDFIPAEIFSTFSNADRLIFMRNGFKEWRNEFLQNAKKLIAFVNVDNLLVSLDDDSFTHTPNLLVLSLYGNQISNISEGAFRGLTQLSILQLSGNKISSIDEKLFRDLESLEMLDLFDNNLPLLPSGVFDANERLQTLRLDGNKFVVITAIVFDRNSNLKSLNVTENLIFSIDAKVLPENLEIIYVGESVTWK